MGLLLGSGLLFLRVLYFVTFVKSQCQPRPVIAPIQSVSLPNGASVRGISIDVGSNNQHISFFASSNYNDTYIFGTNGHCADSISSRACVSFRGSAYNASASSTDQPVSDRTNRDGLKADWQEDTLRFGGNTSLSSFRFGVPQQDLGGAYSSQSQLGLGRNSTFLRALVSTGDIGTKAYSIFWGLVGGTADKQARGSLVLGGLDKSLIADQDANFTARLSYSNRCSTGMSITIDDIFLNWPNGTDTSIFDGSLSAAIQACIDPSFAGLMTLPYSYYQNLWSSAGGTPPDNKSEARSAGINFWTMLFDPNNVYYGGLTLNLLNGIPIKIPNTELVVPDTYIGSDGAVQTNTSVRNLVINSLQAENDKDLPILGRLFLSSAYLLVNQEAGSFSLWQANTGSRTSEIVAVDKQNNMVDKFCANATVPTTSPTPTPQNKESKLSGGVIVGIVAGAAGGLAILGAIGFLLYRKRASGGAALRVSPERDLNTVDGELPPYSMVQDRPHELPVDWDNVAELDGRAK